jgi:hypothetical protein
MNTDANLCEDKPASTLDVLLVYDCVRSGERAKELCDRVGERLPPELELNLSPWGLSVLQDPSLARLAAPVAARADLLIVAVDGATALPMTVQNWIRKHASGARRAGRALVAQLHGILRMNQELAPAYNCLKQLAIDTGMDFFSQVAESADVELTFWIEAIHRRARMTSPVFEGIY